MYIYIYIFYFYSFPLCLIQPPSLLWSAEYYVMSSISS